MLCIYTGATPISHVDKSGDIKFLSISYFNQSVDDTLLIEAATDNTTQIGEVT